jgi:hypothetical protein
MQSFGLGKQYEEEDAEVSLFLKKVFGLLLVHTHHSRLCYVFIMPNVIVVQTLLADPFCLRKLTADPYILAQVDIECPNYRYTKLKLYS